MSLDRANISGGPAKVTWNSATFFSRNPIAVRHEPAWDDVLVDAHGNINKVETDRVITIPMRLWGAWENLSVLFPSAVLTPSIGALPGIFSTTDLPLVILGKNGDQITYHNAQITKLSNLFLGVGETIFAADVEFTALIKNNVNPEDAAAYYTIATGQAYADTTFALTNFARMRFSAAWGAVAGFTAFQAKEGWNIEWELGLEPVKVDALGTVSMTIQKFSAKATCIPIQHTLPQLETASKSQLNALGRLLSTGSADLVITGAASPTPVITLKNAMISGHGHNWGQNLFRTGPTTWETTVGFTTGTAAARAVIA